MPQGLSDAQRLERVERNLRRLADLVEAQRVVNSL